MNLGLRCAQMMAERANIKGMNIIERSKKWYRLERIGQPLSEERFEPEQVTRIYTHINIDNKALELQKRIVSLEEMRGGDIIRRRHKNIL